MKPNIRQGASTLAMPAGSAALERWPAPCRQVATSLPPGALDLQVRVSVRVWAAVAAWPPRRGRRPPAWAGQAASVRPPTAAILTPVEAQGRRSDQPENITLTVATADVGTATGDGLEAVDQVGGEPMVNCPDPCSGLASPQDKRAAPRRPTLPTHRSDQTSDQTVERNVRFSSKNRPLWRMLAAATCGTLAPRDPPRQASPDEGEGPAAHRRRPPMKPNARLAAPTLAAPAGSAAVPGPSRPAGSGS